MTAPVLDAPGITAPTTEPEPEPRVVALPLSLPVAEKHWCGHLGKEVESCPGVKGCPTC